MQKVKFNLCFWFLFYDLRFWVENLFANIKRFNLVKVQRGDTLIFFGFWDRHLAQQILHSGLINHEFLFFVCNFSLRDFWFEIELGLVFGEHVGFIDYCVAFSEIRFLVLLFILWKSPLNLRIGTLILHLFVIFKHLSASRYSWLFNWIFTDCLFFIFEDLALFIDCILRNEFFTAVIIFEFYRLRYVFFFFIHFYWILWLNLFQILH